MITWENYEEYMMMHADGELQPAETQELMEFVNQHPQLKSEMADLQMVRLVPDTMVYANKASLLKEEPAKRVIAFPVWKRYSIAAGVAAIMILSVYRFMNGNNTTAGNANDIAQNNVAVPVSKNMPAGVATEAPGKTQEAQAEVKDVRPAVKQVTPVQSSQKSQIAMAQVPTPQQKESVSVPHSPSPATENRATTVDQLPVAGAKEMQLQTGSYAAVSTTDIPAYDVPVTEDENKKTFLDKLPIDDIKKKQLGVMASAVKDAANGQTLSIKVEKRKLILSF